MKIVDLNILLYVVNQDASQHKPVFNWWQNTINSDETVGLPWVVLAGFLRISTNPRVFPKPLDPVTAIEKVNSWIDIDITRVVQEKDSHWRILRTLLNNAGTAGNLTTDAHIAAIAIAHGAVLASCDSDFSRFEGLRWENPLI